VSGERIAKFLLLNQNFAKWLTMAASVADPAASEFNSSCLCNFTAAAETSHTLGPYPALSTMMTVPTAANTFLQLKSERHSTAVSLGSYGCVTPTYSAECFQYLRLATSYWARAAPSEALPQA
jgi:hypothetical protein